MAVDYDIVIIGGSPAGRYAAVAATQLRATVALVEPPKGQGATIARSALLNQLTPHATTQVGQLAQHLGNANQFGIHFSHADTAENCAISVRWAEAMQWTEGVVSNLEEQNSPVVLASLGVDVIVGSGQFERQPHLAFVVNGRRLRARAYLIATGSRPAIPDIEGLQTTGYVTAPEIWQPLTQKPPNNWVIIGGDPTGCQVAQTLTRLGLNVTLVVRSSHILAKEDPEVAQLVQATLEAEGVRVLTETPVTLVKRIQDKKWVQAGNEAIETDEILLAAGIQPNLESLNLEEVGVKGHRRRLLLNEKLQTTNPRIYACGDVIGGYQFANIANYEARIALKNALFFPVFKVDYRSIPWALFSDPQFARVGLTEAQARRRYTHDVVVLRQYFKTVAAAQLSGETTGVCKLIVLRNGKILGASLVGSQAGELINLIALAINQKLKINAIATLAPVYPSMSEIFEQLAVAWTNASLTNNSQLQFLEGFFNLCRSWKIRG